MTNQRFRTAFSKRVFSALTAVSVLACAATTAVAAPGPFHLLAPDSVWTRAHSPVFSWTASSGASQYEVWVDTVRLVTGVAATSAASPQPLADGRHTWFVKATGGGVILNSADTGAFNIGTPPAHLWDYTDGFERGDLNDYVSDGITIASTSLTGSHSAGYKTASSTTMHYAYNPALINNEEAEASILFTVDDANANVGVGFAGDNGVWCYAMIDRANNIFHVQRRAPYSILTHTETGYTKTNWTEWQENGFYIWSADTQPLPTLTQGTKYRLKFDMSNRLPSMGKACMAVLEKEDSTVLCVVRSILDDVYAPHPLFIMKNGNSRIDDFRFQLLDRWSYNWKTYQKPLNPTWNGFNPAVWRDANKKWWLTARTDNKIRWSSDGINWSDSTANAPPVTIMDPAIVGMHGNPWNDGRTYLASCNGCCFDSVHIFYSTDLKSGVWTQWAQHAGLTLTNGAKGGCGREHVFLDTKDWPTLDSIRYNGVPYRFLSVLEGDYGSGGSTMLKVTNDELNYTPIECHDLYTNSTNNALLQKDLWAIECLNLASSCVIALDSNIRVMGYKDGNGKYEKAFPLEIVLNGKQPWNVNAMQTIPGFPFYWGNRHVIRDKAGASWYGGHGEWPACIVWVEEERNAYCYWGEENEISLSIAHIVPEFRCASLSVDTATVNPGSTVQVTAKIWNYGDVAGDDTVNLVNDGTIVGTKTIHCAANTDTVISFIVTAQASGTHVLSIDNKKAALFVTGSVAIAKSGEAVHVSEIATQPYVIRIIDIMGRTVRTAESDRQDINPSSLLKDCARGLYLAQVFRNSRLITSRLVLR
jgi:hypothetical protein